MRWMSRREFVKRSTGAAVGAGAALAGIRPAWAADTKFTGTMKRTLGKTGIECSLFGMGTGTSAWNGSSAQNRKGRQAFVSLIEHAYASGVTYFDMADMYGAHDYMKEAVKNGVKREHCMFLTKTVSREPNLIQADLERFRKELDTDYLDIVLLHCLTDKDWTGKLQPCMDVLAEAKAKGVIRAHGVSCHDFGAMETSAVTPWVDVMLARINPFGKYMDGTPEAVAGVLKKAHDNGKGILGMKIAGQGEAADKLPESLNFVLGLGCVDAMTIGVLEPGEVDANMNHIAAVTVA